MPVETRPKMLDAAAADKIVVAAAAAIRAFPPLSTSTYLTWITMCTMKTFTMKTSMK